MNINGNNVDIFYDLIDEACMKLYEDIHLDYLDGFIRVTSDILDHFDDSMLSDEAIESLKNIYEKIFALNILNEEIRFALTLIVIKGLKHRNLPLDIITPDTIGYLFTYIVDILGKGNKSSIIDTCLGVSALSQTIVNNAENVNIIGIEKEELYVKVAKSISDLLDNDVKIYFQNPSQVIYDVADFVIGDLGRIDDVYEVVLERLPNLKDNGYFIYLIDNDFFSKTDNGFKRSLDKEATLTGLIVLPDNFTNASHVGKSILIGKKAVLDNYHMSILKIDSFDKETINETFSKVKKMIQQMEG